MRRVLPHWIGGVTIMTAIAFRAPAAPAPPALPEGEPLAVEATALVPVDVESSVAIAGIRGQIVIEGQDARELRVISRTIGENGAELPVGIWQKGTKLIVAPAPGDRHSERNLHVEVPDNFRIVVDATDTTVVIAGARGSVELRGTNLNASVQASSGSIDADLVEGKLSVAESGETTLNLRGTILDVGAMNGNVDVRSAGGTLSIAKGAGSIDVESEGSSLLVDGPTGPVHIKARNGRATVAGVLAGANLEMWGAPLVLKDGKGDITVTSDAAIEFHSMAASLHFDMDGGSLRGKGNQGILEVSGRNSEVNVETIDGGMRIKGDGLKPTITDVGGELFIDTRNSEVTVDRVGSVIANLDRGGLTLKRAVGAVRANVIGGDVQIIDGNGPVTLDLDGGDAEVSWASITGDKESRLTNKGGGVTVRLPASSPCRVTAKSRYGRIDSDVPAVKVTDDLSEAQGSVNGGIRPVIQVDASGDIHLIYGSGNPDEN